MTRSKDRKACDAAAKATTAARRHARIEDGQTTVSDATLTYRLTTRGTDASAGMRICTVDREINLATIEP